MKKPCLFFLFILFLVCFFPVNATAETCGDGFCDLSIPESNENCPQDCIKEETEVIDNSKGKIIGDGGRILPINLQKNMSRWLFIGPLLIVISTFIFLLISKAKIAGKTLKEYLLPIKYYVLGSILVVISQYTIALPFSGHYPFLLNLTQAVWALMVALSVLTLVKKYDFNLKNLLVIGVLYCLIIHGLKISIRYFFYNKPVWYLIDRFIYGSLLVMIIVIPLSLFFLYLRKKGVHF